MTSTGCSADASDDDGFVLVFVVGILLLLSALATALIHGSTLDIKARRNLSAHQELTTVADGVSRLLAYRLGEQRDGIAQPAPIAVDGRLHACSFSDADIRFFVQDHAGLLDLNRASPERLASLLATLGAVDPQGLAAAIADFRDPDDAIRPAGAEGVAYQRAGMPHGPKNHPFDAVEELDQVLGMSAELLRRVRPLLTIRAPGADINQNVAPLGLRSEPTQRLKSDPPDGTSVRLGERGRSRVFSISVSVRRADVVSVRHSIVEFTPRAAVGFAYLAWSDGSADDVPESIAEPAVCD